MKREEIMKIMPINCSLKNNQNASINNSNYRTVNNPSSVSFSANRLNPEEIKKLAQEATQWWCKKLAGGYKCDTGEREMAVNLVAVKAVSNAPDSVRVTLEQMSKFRDALILSLEKEIEKAGEATERPQKVVEIGVDYHPYKMLKDALRQAGFNDLEIDYSCLPTKIGMYIDTESLSIRASDGFARPHETIFTLLKN